MPRSLRVSCLSDDEDGPALSTAASSHQPAGPLRPNLKRAPITELSDSSCESEDLRELGMKRKRKRGKMDPTKVSQREDMATESYMRSVLQKECKGCKRCCLIDFMPRKRFQELMEFREHWLSLHKLDQDRLVSFLCSGSFLLEFASGGGAFKIFGILDNGVVPDLPHWQGF